MNDDKKTFMIDSPDNPYNPFEDFDNWYAYDCNNLHFYTYQFIARWIDLNGVVGDELFDQNYADAVDALIDVFPDRYVKLYEGDKKEYKPTV